MSLTDVNIRAVKMLCEQVLHLASEVQDELAGNPNPQRDAGIRAENGACRLLEAALELPGATSPSDMNVPSRRSVTSVSPR